MSFILETDYLLYMSQRRLDQLKADANIPDVLGAAEGTAITIVKDALYSYFDTDTIFEFNQTGDSVVMFRIENEN